VRHSRHVELTDAGRGLIRAANKLFTDIDQMPQRLNEPSTGLVGSLFVGFTECGSFNGLAAKVVESVIRNAPSLGATFCRKSRSELIEGILERQIPAAFVRPPVLPPSNIKVDQLRAERILLAHNMPGLVLSGPEIGFPELAEMTTLPFILWERDNA
jgi:DNA-binding transcriptional LysR family regulator